LSQTREPKTTDQFPSHVCVIGAVGGTCKFFFEQISGLLGFRPSDVTSLAKRQAQLPHSTTLRD
jgi:hypothetical protein